MAETRERLSRALLREPLVDRDTLRVSQAWLLWYEQAFRVQAGIEAGLTDLESDPQQGDIAVVKRLETPPEPLVAVAPEARRFAKDLEQVLVFSDVPQLAELVTRAFDTGAQFAASEGTPPAPQALNLGRRSGEYYRRWALAI